MFAQISKWTNFNFEATACYSLNTKRPIALDVLGAHKIACVRGFPGTAEAMDYAFDRYEELVRTTNGNQNDTKVDYLGGANSHYDWQSLSDEQLKKNISKQLGVSEKQLTITKLQNN